MIKFKKIYVEITNICNKSCSFCSKDNLIKKEMSLNEFEYILKEIKLYTDYIYLHVKGEPLLHSKLNEILILCNKYKISVNITTNGTLIKKKLNIILNNPCIRQINISLHSFEDIDNQLYLSDIFESVDQILNKTKINVVYRFWALKNNQFSKQNMFIINNIKQKYYLNDIKINEIISKDNVKITDNLYLNKSSIFEWPNLNNKYNTDSGTCLGTKTHIGILVNGTVIPCCLDSCGIINLGNIFEKNLTEILNDNKFISINKGFRDNKLIEPLCQHCRFHN